MSRFLFVVPPLAGHVNPTLAIGRALLSEGHDVAWVGCGERVRALLPDDLMLLPISSLAIAHVSEAWMQRAKTVSGLESFKFFYEDFLIPLGHAMLPGVIEAIDTFQPDRILSDQQALAGPLAARIKGIPFATLATTSAAVFNPIAQFPKVSEWMIEVLGKAQDAYGLERWERPDLSQDLVIILSTRDLVGPQTEMPAHFQFVGPSLRNEVAETQIAFPWERLDGAKKKIFLSLGTLNAERSAKFYQKVKEAFAGKDLQLILAAPPEMIGEIPENFIVQSPLPQLEVLKHVDAVIFHGGHNTFCESLLQGLPGLVLPIKDDQPVVAEQLVRSGAGLRLHFERVKSPDLFASAQRLLVEPHFRDAARRVQKDFERSGGALRAKEHLLRFSQREGALN